MNKNLDYKSYFPIFDSRCNDQHPFVYFDSGASTLKLGSVVEAINAYYKQYPVSDHGVDYKFAHQLSLKLEKSREIIAKHWQAQLENIIFTSGTTMGINQVCFGLQNKLQPNDEIIISSDAHTSLSLPCSRLAKLTKAKLVIIPSSTFLNLNALKKTFTSKVKLLALPHVSNTEGAMYDVVKINSILKTISQDAYFLVDSAQSAAHIPFNFATSMIDFLVFSGHKCYGPTGIGCLIAKKDILNQMEPIFLGGNMNEDVFVQGDFTYKPTPYKFEAGTQNFAGILGLASAFLFLQEINLAKNFETELALKKYAVNKLQQALKDSITIFNPDTKFNLLFNIRQAFAQDVASYLGSKNICVRAGDHCAKLMNYQRKIHPSVRVTFGIYNDKKDVDLLVKALVSGGDFLSEFFE